MDTSGAGEGDLEVTIGAPSGAPVSNYIRPLSTGTLGVFYTPVQSGTHLITAAFNGEVVVGKFDFCCQILEIFEPCIQNLL